jgi:hypothetical protein
VTASSHIRSIGLHQVIDAACRDAMHMRILDHRGQCILGHAPWFKNARKVAAERRRSSSILSMLDQPNAVG